MTPVVDWRELFTAQEAALYELLLDEESDVWHIHELIDAAGLRDRAVVGEGLRALVAPLRTCLGFIDEVLRRHLRIVPALCLREGHYPWIRQRRDVHQFDVGSHLTCCCALAVRGVAVPPPSRAALRCSPPLSTRTSRGQRATCCRPRPCSTTCSGRQGVSASQSWTSNVDQDIDSGGCMAYETVPKVTWDRVPMRIHLEDLRLGGTCAWGVHRKRWPQI